MERYDTFIRVLHYFEALLVVQPKTIDTGTILLTRSIFMEHIMNLVGLASCFSLKMKLKANAESYTIILSAIDCCFRG